MDALLQHLVAMTAHRDPDLRDLAVVTAVHLLAGAMQTRVLGITAAGGQQFLPPRADIAEEVAADGTRTLWLPVWIGERADTCLEIVVRTPCAAATAQQAGDTQQWLAVIDVDHFKLVNDRFGHVYGDAVLILIANRLQSSFRSYDRVFRFGGEEFVVLLRSTTPENARKVIDRLRANVAAQHVAQVGKGTVSVGFVSISARDAPIVIVGHADQALYYAKSHGHAALLSCKSPVVKRQASDGLAGACRPDRVKIAGYRKPRHPDPPSARLPGAVHGG